MERRRRVAGSSVMLAVVSVMIALPFTQGGSATAAPERARPVQVDFRGESTLAAGLAFEGTVVGGLSSIAYDAGRDVYYAICDDQGALGPVRYYTLAIDISDGTLDPGDVTVLDVTRLEPPAGETYAPGTVDPEGLTLTGDDTLVVTSEGVASAGVDPWIREYRLDGSYVRDLTVPEPFLVGPGTGVRLNLGFETATVGHGPFLFTGNEGALAQDGPAATPTNGSVARLLRFRVGPGQADRAFVYPVDPVAAVPVPPDAFSVNGLVELLPLNNQFLLAMERSFSVGVGNSVKLHLVGLPGADDVSGLDSLVGADVQPVTKTEVLDLNTLGLTLDNLEGMTFGPRLADGRRSLVIVSDNNFTPGQVSQFLLVAVR
jgi:3-phytase/alkaline phosphatase D